jgi:nucleotidyltransferase/DNA polymerase involved in DNA repair
VDALPGVGWSLRGKLTAMGISKVCQVWSSSKENLIRKLGKQTGINLWNYAHGR